MSLRTQSITRNCCLVLVAALSVAAALPLAARAQDPAPNAATESQRTEAGALAIEKHWSLAEMTGDTAFLEQFLMPEYRSVNDDGTAKAKAHLIASAAKHTGTDKASAERTLVAYRTAHPYGTSVLVRGSLAILSFYDSALGPQKGVRSSDILVYVDGKWHAIYSQHTGVGKSH